MTKNEKMRVLKYVVIVAWLFLVNQCFNLKKNLRWKDYHCHDRKSFHRHHHFHFHFVKFRSSKTNSHFFRENLSFSFLFSFLHSFLFCFFLCFCLVDFRIFKLWWINVDDIHVDVVVVVKTFSWIIFHIEIFFHNSIMIFVVFIISYWLNCNIAIVVSKNYFKIIVFNVIVVVIFFVVLKIFYIFDRIENNK